eukprot:11352879-Alexandrium_andersonii.AAC.1
MPLLLRLPASQFGAGPWAGTSTPLHSLQAWRSAMNARRRCWAVVFCDLSKAFDATVRQRVFWFIPRSDVGRLRACPA